MPFFLNETRDNLIDWMVSNKGMQQTQTSGSSSSTSTVTTKVSSEHAVAVPVSASAANALVGSKEQQFSTTAASTTAQVITVVAPSHTTQAHGIH